MGRGSSKVGGGSSTTIDETENVSISLNNERTMYFDGRKTTVVDNPLKTAPSDVIDAYNWGGNDNYTVNSIIDHRVNGVGVGKMEELSVSELGSIQDFIEPSRVASMINSGIKPDAIKSQNGKSGISGFRYKGKVYIYDGNHRVVAAMMKGQKKVKVEIDMEIKEK